MDNLMHKTKNLIKEYSAVLIFFLFYANSLLPFPFIQYSDGAWLWIPRLGYEAKEILSGNFPILNSFQFCGNNLLADVSTNILNPTFIFYLFLKPAWSYTISVLLLFFILLIGIWKYFRERNFSWTASVIGVLGYAFGGQILFWSLYHGINLSFTLFPWILFSLRKFENTKLKKWGFLAFIFTFLIMLGGFIQFSIIALLAAIIEGIKDFSLKSVKDIIKTRLIIIFFGILSASVIVIPTIESILSSQRKLVPYLSNLVPKSGLLFWILTFWGNSGQIHDYPNYFYYIGIIIIMLAIYGLRTSFKELISQPFFIFSLIFPLIVLIVCMNILLANFQFGVASDPFRGMFVFIFMLAILAAKGTDFLIDVFKAGNESFKFPIEFKCCFLINLTLTIILIPFMILNKKLIFLWIIIFMLLLFLMLGLILMPILKKKKSKFNVKIFSFWLISLVIINSFFQAKIYLSTNIYHNFTNMFEIRKQQGMPVSILSDESRMVDASPFSFYFEDCAPCYKIRSIGGYATLQPKDIFIRMKKDGLLPKEFNAATHYQNNNNTNPDILTKYGVKYLIIDNNSMKFLKGFIFPSKIKYSITPTKEKLLKEGWQPIFKASNEFIFKNPKYVGRAYIINKKGNILKGVQISIDKDTYIKMQLKGEKGQTLILADSWMPGWECYDNGKKVKGFDANGFKGYTLNVSGIHEIEWKYQPKSFFYGFIISIFSLFAFLLIFFKKEGSGKR